VCPETSVQLELQVETRLADVGAADWAALDHDGGLYQSRPWLTWAETSCGAEPFYVLARNRAGVLVGAVPAYLLSASNTSWNSWYDPLNLFVGDDPETPDRRPDWFPLLAVGSVSGYSSEVLLHPSLDEIGRRDVTRLLLQRCRLLTDEQSASSMALMYAPPATAAAGWEGGTAPAPPVPTSAGTRISACWPDLESYLRSFPSRRRGKLKHEIDVFRSGGSRVVECRLSQCLAQVGPLLGNVHRRHGADDTDVDTAHYLQTQAVQLDEISTVFLEVIDDTPVGFSLCYTWGRDVHVRVVGFDYQRSTRFAYFNLAFYLPLAYAIRHRLRAVHLGPGTYQAKVSRGAVLEPNWSLVWPPNGDHGRWFARRRHASEEALEAARWGQETWSWP